MKRDNAPPAMRMVPAALAGAMAMLGSACVGNLGIARSTGGSVPVDGPATYSPASGPVAAAAPSATPSASATPTPGATATPNSGSFTLTTPAFADGAVIPTRYTGADADVSPPLAWSNAPGGTAQFLVLVEDLSRGNPSFTHWVIYGIPPGATGLPEAVPNTAVVLGGARQLTNDFGTPGYGGPFPPVGDGMHRYSFQVYALSGAPTLSDGMNGQAVRAAISSLVLGQAALVGTFAR